MKHWQHISTAPRNGTWIEIRYNYQGRVTSEHIARSFGNGDMPNIWRFSDGGCLRFESENKYWEWRPITAHPVRGTKWRSRKHGTRLVIDRDFGNRVVYRQLYANKSWSEHRCTLQEWYEYRLTAKIVERL